jgi:sugar phosphate permease
VISDLFGCTAADAVIGRISLNIFTGFGVGLLSKTFGNGFWNNLFLIMAGVAVIGGLIVLPLWNMKNNGYESE